MKHIWPAFVVVVLVCSTGGLCGETSMEEA
jgi:hypothetical protein